MSDPKEQIKSRNIQLDNIFDEVNELKGIFKDAWEDICNDFTQCKIFIFIFIFSLNHQLQIIFIF
jgi:hypothetical protein